MDRQEIKDQIAAIIREAAPSNITADEIYARLTERIDPGRTQETIRKTIRELVNEDAYLIGSSRKGYFYIDSRQKLDEAVHYLTNRIPFLRRRAAKLRELWEEQQEHNNNG